MSVAATPPLPSAVIYPESDGKPMAENTRQLDWIIKLVANLKNLFRDRDDVFVAGNQNWYPVENHKEIVQAPDAYVVFGRPKGFRSSYVQCEEGGVPMTVVFEVLSPSNTFWEMADKQAFYDEYEVEEYYVYDPETNRFDAFVRLGTALRRVRGRLDGFISPRLGIRFDLSGPEMVVRYPDGRPFMTLNELDVHLLATQQRADDERKRADDASKRADDERERADDERQRADDERQRADKAERRLARLAELAQKALLQQATAEEQEELRALLAPSPQP